MSDVDEEREPRFAVLPPFVAQWVLNRLGPGAFRSGAEWALAQGQPEMARALARGFAQLQASAADFEPPAISVDGNEEVPQAGEAADSKCPPEDWWPTRRVAVELRVTPRQVVNLIRGDRLSAARVGRQWLVDPVSVADHKQVRRPA